MSLNISQMERNLVYNIYLFEITIRCKYVRAITFLIRNQHEADLIMELTNRNRIIYNNETLPIQYDREVKYQRFGIFDVRQDVLCYECFLEKWFKYMKLYEALQFHTDDFKKLFFKGYDKKYLNFKYIGIDIQNALTEFYNYCESYYNRSDIDVEQYYDNIVDNKNDNIDRRRIRHGAI